MSAKPASLEDRIRQHWDQLSLHEPRLADTSPGVQDTFMAACDARRYELLGCTEPHRHCHPHNLPCLEQHLILCQAEHFNSGADKHEQAASRLYSPLA